MTTMSANKNGGGPIDISVAVPCLNEEVNAQPIAAAIGDALTRVGVTYEIIFIDNGSTDRTVPLIKDLCAADHRVKLIVNNRNYGQMRSPTHAIYQATGRAVIGMCADFQDPPEMLGQFVERWRSGVQIVLGVRESERSSLVTRVIRALGYGFLHRFADYAVIPGATGFGLYDRKVVDALSQWREPEPFFRGMLVESGFSLETIAYHRPERAGGRSKNNFATILSFGLSALASSSKELLRLPFYVAGAAGILSMLTLIGAIVSFFVGRGGSALLLATLIQANFAIVFGFLGLIGEQVRLVSERVRNTPLVIEKERVNF